MNRTKLFSIIEFDEGLELVLSKWLTENKKDCFYPPYSTTRRVQTALKDLEDPDSNWKLYPVKRIFSQSNDYKRGLEKLKKAECQSDNFSSTEYESGTEFAYPAVPQAMLVEKEDLCRSPLVVSDNKKQRTCRKEKEAVRVTFSTATNKDVTKPLSSWLRHARERLEKQKMK